MEALQRKQGNFDKL